MKLKEDAIWGKTITYLSKIFGASTSQSKFTKISIIT
jgi:hypothetical protein